MEDSQLDRQVFPGLRHKLGPGQQVPNRDGGPRELGGPCRSVRELKVEHLGRAPLGHGLPQRRPGPHQRLERGRGRRNLQRCLEEPDKVEHDQDQVRVGLLNVRRERGREDGGQVWGGNQRRDPDLGEPVAERRGELLFPKVASGVHGGQDAKPRRALEDFGRLASLFGQDQSLRRLEDRVEPLQHGILGQRDLVDEEERARLHGQRQRPVIPREKRARVASTSTANLVIIIIIDTNDVVLVVGCSGGGGGCSGSVGTERAQKVRGLGVLVDVDDGEVLRAERGQELADGGFAGTGGADQKDGLAGGNGCLDKSQHPGETRGENEVLAKWRGLEGLDDGRVDIVGREVEGDTHVLGQRVRDGDLFGLVTQTLSQKHKPFAGQRVVPREVAFCPAEEVTRGDVPVLPGKDRGGGADPLELVHDGDHLGGVGAGHLAPLLENVNQLVVRDVLDVDLEEPVGKGLGEDLPATVHSGWVLGGKETEGGVGRDPRAGLGDKQLAVVIQQPVERFQDLGGSQVELVQDQPRSGADSLDEEALLEHEGAGRGGDVGAHVLLEIGVLVVVDADKGVPCRAGQVLDHGRLSCRGRALEENGVLACQDAAGQVAEVGGHGFRENEARVGVGGVGPGGEVKLLKEDVRRRGGGWVGRGLERVEVLFVQQVCGHERAEEYLGLARELRHKGHGKALVERAGLAVERDERAGKGKGTGERAERVDGAGACAVSQRGLGGLPGGRVKGDNGGDGDGRKEAVEVGPDNQTEVCGRGELWDVNLCEPRAEARGEVLLPDVCGRVHGTKEAEPRVRAKRLDVAALGEKEVGRAGRLEEASEALEGGRGGQVDLIEEDPVACAEGRDELAFDKGKGKGRGESVLLGDDPLEGVLEGGPAGPEFRTEVFLFGDHGKGGEEGRDEAVVLALGKGGVDLFEELCVGGA